MIPVAQQGLAARWPPPYDGPNHTVPASVATAHLTVAYARLPQHHGHSGILHKNEASCAT
jgi:hypothetical protein